MILIGAGASLILLINAAYQDGGREKPLPAALRWAMRLASLLLLPLTVLAAYALWLRVGQYGLTIERIIAVAFVVVGACYAVGYALAAVLPGPAMRRLEPTNVATSFVGLAVLLALLSPLADPVRLSVDNQVARLQAGKVKPADFDFEYLKFSAGRFGETALARLVKDGGEVGRFARVVQAQKFQGSANALPEKQQSIAGMKVYPAGRAAPESLKASWSNLIGTECSKDSMACELFLMDINGDGQEEVLIKASTNHMSVLEFDKDTGWARRGVVKLPYCPRNAEAGAAGLRAGRYETKPSRWREVVVDGVVLAVDPVDSDCPAATPKASAEPPVH
jgi:hypothetical protein